MITNTNQLTETQLQELHELQVACRKADGSTPNLYTHILNQARMFPASLLYYEQGQLKGFLSVYFFYDDAVEISILVHPQARRRGIATELVRSILPLIQSQNYHKLIFSNPGHINSSWLKTKGFAYLHSENYMERDDLKPLLEFNQTLQYRSATYEDLYFLGALDEMCFPSKSGESMNRIHTLIEDRNYEIIIALQDATPIGKAHLRWLPQGATFSDIAILPDKQGKGLGTALIAYCINYALSEGKPHLNLDVETQNQRALSLYTRLGFLSQNTCDYWTIDIGQLIK